MAKVGYNKYTRRWDIYHDGYAFGSFLTPKYARHKARMWYMWLTTGDKTYLRKEMKRGL